MTIEESMFKQGMARYGHLWEGKPSAPLSAIKWPICSTCSANLKKGARCSKHPTAEIISGDI